MGPSLEGRDSGSVSVCFEWEAVKDVGVEEAMC